MRYRGIYILTPILLFLAIWIAVILLHFYYNPYSFIVIGEFSRFLIVSSVFFLILGFAIVHFSISNPALKQNIQVSIDERKAAKFIIFVSTLIWIGIFLNVHSLGTEFGGLKLFLQNPFKARSKIIVLTESNIENYNFIYSLSNYITSLNFPLTVVGGVFFTHRSKWRFIGLLPIFQGLVISLITLGRFSAMTTLGYWFLALFFSSFFYNPEQTKALFLRTAKSGLFIIFILVVFFFMIVRVRTFYLKNINDLFVKSIYTYFVGPVSALDVFVNSDSQHLFGASAFRSVFKWLARFGLWEAQDVLKTNNPFVAIGSWTSINTFSFVKTFYEDFGLGGIILGSAIWGGLVRYFIEKSIRNFTLTNMFLLVVMTFSLVMSFYAFYFEGLTALVLYLLYMMVFERYFQKNRIIQLIN